MKVLQLQGVEKRFQERIVLNNVSFEIDEGEVVAIVGPSGGGKTTLLRVIAGLESIDQGTIIINGQMLVEDGEYGAKSKQEQATKSLGFVFQQFNLFPNLTVGDNLLLSPLSTKKKTKEELLDKVTRILSSFGLDHYENRTIETLSGGEKQRVAIARALMLDPAILLFDEPTSALDSKRIQDLIALILRLKQENRTMLVVTHDLEFAKAIASRIVPMELLNSK